MFADRTAAARSLSERLTKYQGSHVMVLGLARGGVVIAKEIGEKLSLRWDVLVVKKISGPGDPELAIGAVAPDGICVVDYLFAHRLGVDEAYLAETIKERSEMVKQKMSLYRKGKLPLIVKDKMVIVVDDGAATGESMTAAVKWLKEKQVKFIVVALPVAPSDVVSKLQKEVDECIVLATPSDFASVGAFYEHFNQVEDREVVRLLQSDKSDK